MKSPPIRAARVVSASVVKTFRIATLSLLALLCCAAPAAAQLVLTEGTNLSVDVAPDGRIATDLLGGIWIVPMNGGPAEALAKGLLPAERPRWSPGGDAIVYQARAGSQQQLWRYDFATNDSANISDGDYFDQQPDWHPDGSRVVYSSDRRDSGFDIWETDLQTGLSWRLSSLPGDETEPAWSADGEDLLFIYEYEEQWSLLLRRRGKPDEVLVTSATRLSAPSWRPDGSLVTYLRHTDGLHVEMAILSEPLLIRPLISGEDFFDTPVAWHGRQQMLYAANGVIRKREFNSWTSRTVPFRAIVKETASSAPQSISKRILPLMDAPATRLVIRAERLLDGTGGDYRRGLDVVIDGGVITSVAAQQDHGKDIVIDMGNLTILPGFVDIYANLPEDVDESLGPLLLSFGVTTIVADHERAADLNRTWSGKAMPGPRLLRAQDVAASRNDEADPWLVTISGDLDSGVASRKLVSEWRSSGIPVLAQSWQVAVGSGANLMLGGASMPASPRGIRYQDSMLATGAGSVTLVSGLADAHTPGLRSLLQSRQVPMLGDDVTASRRFAESPHLPSGTTSVVTGSKPNGLPPGVALHAELRALQAAGLDTEHVLRAASSNAAKALSLNLQLGRVAAGAHADLILVDGDPVKNVSDTLKVVAVVRNGRFYSVAGLLDTATAARNR